MHCASCKALIESVALDVAGVIACRVDEAAGLAEIEYGAAFDPAEMKAEIEKLGGYRVELV